MVSQIQYGSTVNVLKFRTPFLSLSVLNKNVGYHLSGLEFTNGLSE